MTIERRIGKLENLEESRNPTKFIILRVLYEGDRKPTEEEVEAAKKKFLEEHPGHQGFIVLDFKHLGE
jgi:hypothetical protein